MCYSRHSCISNQGYHVLHPPLLYQQPRLSCVTPATLVSATKALRVRMTSSKIAMSTAYPWKWLPSSDVTGYVLTSLLMEASMGWELIVTYPLEQILFSIHWSRCCSLSIGVDIVLYPLEQILFSLHWSTYCSLSNPQLGRVFYTAFSLVWLVVSDQIFSLE